MSEIGYANRLRENQQADRKVKQDSYNRQQVSGSSRLPGLNSPEEFAARSAGAGVSRSASRQSRQQSRQGEPRSLGSRAAGLARRALLGKQFEKGLMAGAKSGVAQYAKTGAKTIGKWLAVSLLTDPVGWLIILLMLIVSGVALLLIVGCNALSGWDWVGCKVFTLGQG